MSSNNDKRRKRYAEKSVLKYYYVSTVADYNARLARQNGACAICKTKPDHTLCVDHCHVTREVRGLLCRGCNLGLGNYKDDPRLLRAARPFSRTRRPRLLQLGNECHNTPEQAENVTPCVWLP